MTTLVGYASAFGNVDSYGDVVIRGAFADDVKAINAGRKTVPVLFAHGQKDLDAYVGLVTHAAEDGHGLRVSMELDESPEATKVAQLIKAGALSRMSFGYSVRSRRPGQRAGKPTNELTALDLHEVSVVLVPANAEARLVSIDGQRLPSAPSGVDRAAAEQALVELAKGEADRLQRQLLALEKVAAITRSADVERQADAIAARIRRITFGR